MSQTLDDKEQIDARISNATSREEFEAAIADWIDSIPDEIRKESKKKIQRKDAVQRIQKFTELMNELLATKSRW